MKKFLTCATQRLSIDNLQHSGRSEILTWQDKQAILSAARTMQSLTNEVLRQLHAPHTSVITIKRFLQKHNIRKYLGKNRLKLTQEHARNHLAWALEYKDWDAEQFEGAIWSDE
jgi:hypothetical protein